MADEVRQDLGITNPRNRIDIFLDGAADPILSTTPPLTFDLHTSHMEDGPHLTIGQVGGTSLLSRTDHAARPHGSW